MWYIANGTIGKSSSSAAVAEPNYSSAAYQWQSRHYHCPHQTLHASPLQTTAETHQRYDGGCIHRRCKLWCSSPTRYPEQTIYSLRQLKAVHGLQRHTSWQCMSVAGQSYSWPSRIGAQTVLQIRTLYWLVKSVQVQEAGKKYELMVNQKQWT